MAPRRHRWLASCTLIALLMMGCGGNEDADEPTHDTSTTTDTTEGDTHDVLDTGDVPSDVALVDTTGDTALPLADSLDTQDDTATTDTEPQGDTEPPHDTEYEVVPPDTSQDTALEVADDTAEEVSPALCEATDLLLTVDRIPTSMNGEEPAPGPDGVPVDFDLVLPTVGATIDVILATSCATEDLSITASVALGPNGAVPAGQDLVDLFEPTDDGLRLLLGDDLALPEGQDVTFSAHLAGALASSVTFDVMVMPAALDPFVTIDPWRVWMGQDVWDITVEAGPDGTYSVVSTHLEAGDGVPDFEEDLAILGILGDNDEWNTLAKAAMLDTIKQVLYAAFLLGEDGTIGVDSVRVELLFDDDPTAPDPLSFVEGGTFSVISVGGDATPDKAAEGIIGWGWIDWNNQDVDSDAGYGWGVFPTNIVRRILGEPLGALLLGPISPVDGLPLGMYEGDLAMLAEDFDPTAITDPMLEKRWSLWESVRSMFALGVGLTIAHEMGHSLGLVPYGLPPEGLFSGIDDLPFTVGPSSGAHIDTAGLNIMQVGKSLKASDILGGTASFNPVNLAYLQRRLVVGVTP